MCYDVTLLFVIFSDLIFGGDRMIRSNRCVCDENYIDEETYESGYLAKNVTLYLVLLQQSLSNNLTIGRNQSMYELNIRNFKEFSKFCLNKDCVSNNLTNTTYGIFSVDKDDNNDNNDNNNNNNNLKENVFCHNLQSFLCSKSKSMDDYNNICTVNAKYNLLCDVFWNEYYCMCLNSILRI